MGREDLKGCTYTRSVRNVFMNISRNIHSKTPVLNSHFNKVGDLQACNLIKTRI